MSWVDDGLNTGNSVTFKQFRCTVCGRKLTTCGEPPATPCVCSPGPRKGGSGKGRARR